MVASGSVKAKGWIRIPYDTLDDLVAQLIEHMGLNPAGVTNGDVAQKVEHLFEAQGVVGSYRPSPQMGS